MFKTQEGSTQRLLQLCAAYFIFYVITGVTVKYFLGSPDKGYPGMQGFEFLVYSTLGGMMIGTGIPIILRWFHFESTRKVQVLGLSIPHEFFYIIPSGICTGVVIPTTTIMYSLPISVMVAMIIMRGSVIIISRVVDAIQIWQGIFTKKVYAAENWAVVFSVIAIGVYLIWTDKAGFDFVHSVVAVGTLLSYIVAYSFRIYIMNYYKNTSGKGGKRDNKPFFAIEQIAACVTVLLSAVIIFNAPVWFNWQAEQIIDVREAVLTPHPLWHLGVLAGTAYGMVAFFSVFIFMFKGRSATFAGLVNRLTSLVAGTAATLLCWFFLDGKMPKFADWLSLFFILVSVGFLTLAEKKRARELAIVSGSG
ncbi:MAG: hypothetical protein HQM16_12595 [Deltaproteobacteria bacterium]|nr:hypothetical protein [Deltaproteobacteria bacterium]